MGDAHPTHYTPGTSDPYIHGYPVEVAEPTKTSSANSATANASSTSSAPANRSTQSACISSANEPPTASSTSNASKAGKDKPAASRRNEGDEGHEENFSTTDGIQERRV